MGSYYDDDETPRVPDFMDDDFDDEDDEERPDVDPFLGGAGDEDDDGPTGLDQDDDFEEGEF